MRATKLRFAILALTMGVTLTSCNAEKKEQGKTTKKEKTMKVTELTKNEFLKKVYNFEVNKTLWKSEGDKPMIVDFFATWCGPCKALAPSLEAMAEKYEGKIDVYKVDVDKEEALAAEFNIQTIPTLLFIPKAGNPTITNGGMSRAELEKKIEEILLK